MPFIDDSWKPISMFCQSAALILWEKKQGRYFSQTQCRDA